MMMISMTMTIMIINITTRMLLAMVRRMMLIEQAYRDSDVPNYDGAEFFEGDEQATDGSMVAPQLRRYVAEQLKDEAAIAKERRKAQEERQLKKAKPPKKNKGDGKGKADPEA